MISIIVTVYNIEQNIAECLESIIAQNYRDIEIIVVDDDSTDDSGKICDQYAKRDGRIHVIHKKHEGLVNARKYGLKIAKGEYIGYVDGDDWINPEMYSSLLNYAEKYDVDVVCSGRIEEYGSYSKHCPNKVSEGYYSKDNYPQLMRNMFFSGIFFDFGV